MREIKFRGREKETDNWVFGYVRHWKNCFGDEWHIQDENDYVHVVIPATVGQYTGEKDARGIEIYEGDILAYSDELGTTIKGRVQFLDGSFFVTPLDREYGKHLKVITACYYPSGVIGNAHDNPELLERML